VDPPPTFPLATIRKRKLLSQRALANEAGVALSTIYLLEAGKTEHATFKVMRAITTALNVPPNQSPSSARSSTPLQTPSLIAHIADAQL